MKSLLRNTIIYAFALFATANIIEGFRVQGGFFVYVFAGLVLSLMLFILRPLLNLITMPINLITFGTFSFVSNVIILYLLTIFIPQISISAFIFKGAYFAGFAAPKIAFNIILAYIISSLVLSAIVTGIEWLMSK